MAFFGEGGARDLDHILEEMIKIVLGFIHESGLSWTNTVKPSFNVNKSNNFDLINIFNLYCMIGCMNV